MHRCCGKQGRSLGNHLQDGIRKECVTRTQSQWLSTLTSTSYLTPLDGNLQDSRNAQSLRSEHFDMQTRLSYTPSGQNLCACVVSLCLKTMNRQWNLTKLMATPNGEMLKNWNSTKSMNAKPSLTRGEDADLCLTTRRHVHTLHMLSNMMDITKHDWLLAGISPRHPLILSTPVWCHCAGFEFSPSSLSSTIVNSGPQTLAMPILNHSPRRKCLLSQDLNLVNVKDTLSSYPKPFMDYAVVAYTGPNGWQMCYARWALFLQRPSLTFG